ncbi:MAG: hypothetical protein VYB37_13350 [Pseudomonadota bacterium]|nr:hypothetical protein [Pseudomonadota bacterium]
MAAAFAERGDAVWVVDINETNLVACPSSWRQDCLDVTDESAVSDFFSTTALAMGHTRCAVCQCRSRRADRSRLKRSAWKTGVDVFPLVSMARFSSRNRRR